MSPRVALDLDAASLSDIGLLRERNEDACGDATSADERSRLFVVADGMGGHAGGSVASRLAVESALASFRKISKVTLEALRGVMLRANVVVYERARGSADLAGMGTTGVMLAVTEAGAFVANVGDSRAYRLRDGSLEQLTRDHSLVAEMERRGIIGPGEARLHPRRNELLQSLGAEREVHVDVDAIDVRPGDVFLLCSDGLCGFVEDDAIAALLDAPVVDAAAALVEAALGQGGPDNITVQVVRIPSP